MTRTGGNALARAASRDNHPVIERRTAMEMFIVHW
jgi:hypothetical protein